MSFKTDAGGLATKCCIKVSTTQSGSTWNTRLSQLLKDEKELIICTYSLPEIKYVTKILSKRENGRGITLLVHDKFKEKAVLLKQDYPELKIFLATNTHAKLIISPPETVWLSSANLGDSGWFESTIGLKSREAYDYYQNQILKFIEHNTQELF